MASLNGFPPILGVFYAIFHPTQGSKVVCQIPDGLVIPTATSEVAEPLLPFDLLKNYLIPKSSLCNRLVGLKYSDKYILGHPVNIIGEEYERNSFTFNFVFIFPDIEGVKPYEVAIQRLAKMFTALEHQSRFLSNPQNVYRIDSILEQMFQDLNNYSECQIPIDEANRVNIKLFPVLEPPPAIEGHHVPIPTVQISDLRDESWDPTMDRIIPYINGINSVRRISDMAEADFSFTKECIQYLIHYDCVILIGIVQFSNIYACGPNVRSIATDLNMYRELCAFVYQKNIHPQRRSSNSQSSLPSDAERTSTPGSASSIPGYTSKLSPVEVLKLYTSLQHGVNLSSWYLEHAELLRNIDLRRFLTFGVIKELIYRVHAYFVYEPWVTAARLGKPYHVPTDFVIRRALEASEIPETVDGVEIVRKCFRKPCAVDELCTDLRAPRAKVVKLLRGLGDFTVLNR